MYHFDTHVLRLDRCSQGSQNVEIHIDYLCGIVSVRGFFVARGRFGVALTEIRGSGVTGFGVPLTPKAKKWPISLLYSVSYGDAKIP